MPDFLQRAIDLHQPGVASVLDEVSLWSSRFGALLFKYLPLRPHLNILDLACGTGFPLFELAQVYGTSCHVTGIDIWTEAIERARVKQSVYQLANVSILEADAERLPFGEREFDLIVCHLGINNFADPPAVLAECHRVAKPHAALVLTTNTVGHMGEFYTQFREVLTELELSLYLERLEKQEGHRGTRDSLCRQLQSAGFQVTMVEEEQFQLRYLDAGALFDHILTQIGFLDGWRQVVGPHDEERVFTLLEARLNQIATATGEVFMTVPMLYLEAEKVA